MQALFCFVASAICLIAAAACFKANQRYRSAIDTSLNSAMNVPEQVWPLYDAAYLNMFISTARKQSTPLGMNAPALYVRPTLLWIDVSFAIFCAGFAALFWFGWLRLLRDYPAAELPLQFLLVMAVLYGLADVVEDLWLVRLFLKRAEVTKGETGTCLSVKRIEERASKRFARQVTTE